MEPRHFWRRLLAATADFILLSQLVFYLVAPFADGDRLRLSGGLYQSVRCQLVPLSAEAQAEFAALGVVARKGSLCNAYQNGLFAGANLLVSSQTNDEGDIAEGARIINLALNREGQRVEPVFPLAYLQPVLVFLLIIAQTWLLKGQTLGKKLTGIRVVTLAGRAPGLGMVARRESLKFAPAILLYLAGLVAPAYALEHVVPMLQKGENIALVLGFLGVATFIYILWWVAPMLWWNGAMPYDRLSKTRLTRAFALVTPGESPM